MQAQDLQILYCDNHLLVVNKPAGLPVQADASGDPDLLTLGKAWLAREFNKPGAVFLGLVHRLDRPARGVVALARTSKAAARLTQQFAGRTVQKRYQAVVRGNAIPDAAACRDWLLKQDGPSTRVVRQGTAGGQLAELEFTVLGRQAGMAWLAIDLHSGRKHQIRVQLSSRGWPICGDLRYGASAPLADRSIALLAKSLGLHHPTRGDWLQFEAPDPPGWPWQLPGL